MASNRIDLPPASRDAFEPTEDRSWTVVDDSSDHLRESSRETRFAVSNGFLGVRASRAINRDGHLVLPPRTYVAGLFDTAGPDAPISALVPVGDWLQLKLMTETSGTRNLIDLGPRRLCLDMQRGMLLSTSRQVSGDAPGLRLRTFHLVSLAARSIGLQVIEVATDVAGVNVLLEAFIDVAGFALVRERLTQGEGSWHTKRSGKHFAMAIASGLQTERTGIDSALRGQFSSTWQWTSHEHEVLTFYRIVSFARTNGDGPGVLEKARGALQRAERLGWRGLLAEHERAWAARSAQGDVVVTGDPGAQQALRFAVYQLNGAADPTDDRVSVGARGLTGEDYHGHVFWDTEIYLVPFYVMTWPEAARALLMYRFHTLGAARAKATRMGWRGALYAWESADTGDETAPDHVIGPDRQIVAILSGKEELHISADVAYAVWHYWHATHDEAFLLDAGAEILFETARFWSSRATLEADGGRHIRGVIGPDEYHENVDDNAFTNVMARWNIRRALDVAALLQERWPARWVALSQHLDLMTDELGQWRAAADTIVAGFDPKSGLYEQFAGYFALENIDLRDYAGRSVPMDVVLGRERIQHSQIVKQADVVALLGLLPDEFPTGTAATNFAYYEPRCGHGSSLSAAMHAMVAAQLGEHDMAMRYFKDTTAIDLRDTHAAIEGGVHVAALGGAWMTVIYGFAGLTLRDDGLALAPRLPQTWTTLRFNLCWRGRRLGVAIDGERHQLDVALEGGDAMVLHVAGEAHPLDMTHPFAGGYSV